MTLEYLTSRCKRVGECLIWQGAITDNGYPRFGIGKTCQKRTYRANRVMLEIKLGRPIRPGFESCHRCNNRRCLEPEHLFEGTHNENMQDAVLNGRIGQRDKHWKKI